jgi:hypothetical protein
VKFLALLRTREAVQLELPASAQLSVELQETCKKQVDNTGKADNMSTFGEEWKTHES